MKPIILLSTLAFFVSLSVANAAVFTVTPDVDSDCSDFACDIYSAFAAAESNGEEDTIALEAGTYEIIETLTYQPTSDATAFTIQGTGSDVTFLESSGLEEVLSIDTTGLTDDADAHITISGVAFTNGSDPDDEAGIYIHTNDGDITFQDSTIEIGATLVCNGDGSISFSAQENITLGQTTTLDAESITIEVDGGGAIVLDGTLEAESISIDSGVVEDITFSGNLETGSLTVSGGSVQIDSSAEIVTLEDTDTSLAVEFNDNSVGIDLSNTGGTITLTDNNITVVEGNTVTLSSSSVDDSVTYQWGQISGVSVTLSDVTAANPTLVAPLVDTDDTAGVTVSFQVVATDANGTESTSTVTLTVSDNGITGFPENAITFTSSTEENLGVYVDSGGSLTMIDTIDPDTIDDTTGKPQDLIYGLVDLEIAVDTPGDTATVTLYLPEPAPEGYTWYKYDSAAGWYDFNDYAVFNDDRDQITLTLVDGGIGDDDGTANGVIKDPSGLGIDEASDGSEVTSTISADVSVGCFIFTAAGCL
jgi:K319L-like, PKD domain